MIEYFSTSKFLQSSKAAVCSKMSISDSNLYYKPKLPVKDLALKGQIESVLVEHKNYGYRRIAIALNVNKKRVQRVMKLFGIRAKKNKNKPRFKKNKFPINSAKNLSQIAKNQLPFVIAKSLTNTAQEAQNEVRKHISDEFQIRKKSGGFESSIRIKPATKKEFNIRSLHYG